MQKSGLTVPRTFSKQSGDQINPKERREPWEEYWGGDITFKKQEGIRNSLNIIHAVT